MLHVLLEKWICEKKPMTFTLLRFLEISGLFCGILFLVLGKAMLIPIFLQYHLHIISAFITLIISSIIYILFSFAAVFLHNQFWKFFFIGTQILIFARAFYRLLTVGFSNVFIQGFIGNNAVIITTICLLILIFLRYIYFSVLDLKVVQIPGIFAVGRFPADEQFSGKFNDSPELFFSTTRTQNELSVVTESKIFLRNYPMYDDLLLFEFTRANVNGVPNCLFYKILRALDYVKIPYFSISTFEKNYVLFKSVHLPMARHTWHFLGIKVNEHE